jgi:hypothetical protein
MPVFLKSGCLNLLETTRLLLVWSGIDLLLKPFYKAAVIIVMEVI